MTSNLLVTELLKQCLRHFRLKSPLVIEWFFKFNLLHDFSSLPSEQSGFPSHIQVSGTHSPGTDLQVNSSKLQTFFSGIKNKCKFFDSSKTLTCVTDAQTTVIGV